MNKVFLQAEWRYLAMLNFAIDPSILKPLVPAGTELDFYNGACFISVVGFQFLKTRVLGIPFAFHRNFEEVNLRFYVRRKSAEGWRRGVVFISELVPRQAIAMIARNFYGEPYTAVPMRHSIDENNGKLHVKYSWKRGAMWESLSMDAKGDPQEVQPGSQEEFIAEHYWGYTPRGEITSEFAVEHPKWRIWLGTRAALDCDVEALYGSHFVECLCTPPSSAFIAEGSKVVVRFGGTIERGA